MEVLAQLGEEQKFSLGPIYKGRANSLLAQPMKPVSNPNPQFNELYITIAKFGNRIQNVESKLREDFSNTKERVEFIKHAQTTGDVYIIRINSLPVLDPITTLTRKIYLSWCRLIYPLHGILKKKSKVSLVSPSLPISPKKYFYA